MAYCSVTDIQNKYKSLDIGASTAVTTTKVQSLIDGYSALIDGRIAKVYVVPVDVSTATAAAQILKLICVTCVVAELDPIVGHAHKDDNNKKGRDGLTLPPLAETMLSQIEDGQLELADATRKGTSTSRMFRSGNVNAGVCPVFKKDRTQW